MSNNFLMHSALFLPKHVAMYHSSFAFHVCSGTVAAFTDICAEKSRIALSLSSAHVSVYPTQLRSLQALVDAFSSVSGSQTSALSTAALPANSPPPPPSSVVSVNDTIWTLPEALMIECDSSQFDICGEPPPCVLTASDNNSAPPFAYVTPILTVACNGCELSAYRSFTTHSSEDHVPSTSSHASSSASALSKLTKIFSRKRTIAPASTLRETSFTLCAGIECFSVLSSSTRSLLFDSALTSAPDRLSLKLMEIASVSAGFQLPLVEWRTENCPVTVPNPAPVISELRINVNAVSLFAFPSMFFAASVLSQFSNLTPSSSSDPAAMSSAPPSSSAKPTPLDSLHKFLTAPVNVHCVLHSAHARLFNEQLIAVLAVSTEELIFESPVVVSESGDGASGLLERSFIASWSSLRVCALPSLGHVVSLVPPCSSAAEEAIDPYAPLNFIPFFSGSAASSSASSSSTSSGSLSSSKFGGVVSARPGTGHWVSIERCSFLLQTVVTDISSARPSVELDVAIGLTRPCINVDVSQLDLALCILHRHMLPFLPSMLDHTVLPPSGLDKFHSKSIALHENLKSSTPLASQSLSETVAFGQGQSLNPVSSAWTLNWRLEIDRSSLFVSSPDSSSLPDEENSLANHKCPGPCR